MPLKDTFFYAELFKKPLKKLICLFRNVKSGTNTFISRKAEIVNPRRIELGSDVAIEKYSRLICIGSRGRISIGDRTFIRPYALLKADDGRIAIGRDCTVNDYSILYARGDLNIGNDVHIAAHVVIVPMNHIYRDPDLLISEQGISQVGVTIEDDVWIGVSAVILDGVTIGKGSVIGAGAVVTRTMPAYSVVAGVPARVIKERKK